MHWERPAQTPLTPFCFGTFPDLEFDSWVTIGIDQVPNASHGEGAVELVSDGAQPWAVTFEQGGDVLINSSVGGAWFSTNNQSNGLPDADGRVLLGQFTTDGELGRIHQCFGFS